MLKNPAVQEPPCSFGRAESAAAVIASEFIIPGDLFDVEGVF